jgi:hypothetical protein
MGFNIDNYKGNYVMHCKTEEEAKDFCKYLHSLGRKWYAGNSYLKDTCWDDYEENTGYYFNKGTFGHIHTAYRYGYTILEWSDFMSTEFTKDKLESGMVVEYRNGERRLVVNRLFIGEIAYGSLGNFDENLKHKCGNSELDIVKVYKAYDNSFECMFKDYNLTLIWERKEVVKLTVKEICEKLGYDVEIVKE